MSPPNVVRVRHLRLSSKALIIGETVNNYQYLKKFLFLYIQLFCVECPVLVKCFGVVMIQIYRVVIRALDVFSLSLFTGSQDASTSNEGLIIILCEKQSV